MLPAGRAETAGLSVDRFANGELSVQVEGEVAGRPCLLLGAVAPPDEQLLALALAADTLRMEGATRVTALLPYLAYARQDKQEPGRGLGIAWVGRVLRACGVDEVTVIDIHSRQAAKLLGLPVTSLSPAGVFAAQLKREGLLDATVVAPDEGAVERARAVANAAEIPGPITHLRKQRTPAGVTHRELVGGLGRRAVVIDDILDTGETLSSCCHELHRKGVEEVTVMVTHGLFTGGRWRELMPLVDRLYVTDSIPPRAGRSPEGAAVLSVRPLIEQALASATIPGERGAAERGW
jgi:ribose-phosphate pyrophosphokinase